MVSQSEQFELLRGSVGEWKYAAHENTEPIGEIAPRPGRAPE